MVRATGASADNYRADVSTRKSRTRAEHDFQIVDKRTGRVVDGGRGFTDLFSRDDAIEIAMRRVRNERPRKLNDKIATPGSIAVVSHLVASLYGPERSLR